MRMCWRPQRHHSKRAPTHFSHAHHAHHGDDAGFLCRFSRWAPSGQFPLLSMNPTQSNRSYIAGGVRAISTT